MALSNINKFSPYVNGAAGSGLLMPKLAFRFRLGFSKFGGAYGIATSGGDATKILELTKQVVSCTRPNVTFAPITLDTYNSKVYIYGKPEWQEITLVVRDDMSGNISRVVGEQIQKQFDFFEQASAAASGDYKFAMEIDMLDGGNGANAPGVLESWEISGCFLSSVNYNEVNYATNDPVTISMTIRIDNALQFNASGANGVGVAVGRNVGNMLAV